MKQSGILMFIGGLILVIGAAESNNIASMVLFGMIGIVMIAAGSKQKLNGV